MKGVIKREYDGRWWQVTAAIGDLVALTERVDILDSNAPIVQKVNEIKFLEAEKIVKDTLEGIVGSPIEWEVVK